MWYLYPGICGFNVRFVGVIRGILDEDIPAVCGGERFLLYFCIFVPKLEIGNWKLRFCCCGV